MTLGILKKINRKKLSQLNIYIAVSTICLLLLIYPSYKLFQYLEEVNLRKSIQRSDLISPVIVSISSTTLSAKEKDVLERINPFGVILYKYHIKSLQQTKQLIRDIKAVFKDRPIYITIDQEGGYVDRISKILPKERSKKLLKKASYYSKLATKNLQLAKKELYQDSKYTASILKEIGIDINFAPMVDIGNTVESGPIAHRTYGNNPQTIIALAQEFIKGMQQEGVMVTLKHAPGIGSGTTDSHKSEVFISKTKANLIKNDLLPFKKLSKISDFVLVSHATFTDIDNKPATMSKKTIDFFKKNSGYEGIIISDAINMKAAMKELKNDLDSVQKYKDIAKRIFDSGVDVVISNCEFIKCEIGIRSASIESGATERLNNKINLIKKDF